MKIRFRLIYLSVLITLVINSCGKNDGPPPDPGPAPRGNDSLGIGWQKIPMPDSIYFDDVFFVNDMIGYVAGSYLAKSVDGGLTWTRLNVPGSQGGYSNIYFTDALHGCAVGSGVIWTTIDGGQNWQGKGGLSGFDVQFISATEGYMCGVSGLYKTIDGGFNWTKVPSITNDLSLSALFFLNNNLGWVALTIQVRKTEDGLNSFGLAVNATFSSTIYTMQFIDNNHGWASSFNGSIVRTVNGGSSWEEIVKDDRFSDIHFFDNNNGFLFSGPNIYLTNNGGTTLLRQAVIRKSSLTEIHFTNPNHGWAVGDMGGLYRYSK